MKKNYITSLFLLFYITIQAQNLYPTLYDGSNGITNGYGAWGTYNYTREASIDVPGKGTITFYHPDNIAPVTHPTLIFISGWGQTYESYDKYFKYVASLGYPVINIYNTSPGSINTSYQNSLDMIQQAVNTYNGWIDTTRIGLAGHSYGGGSTIWLGYHLFDPNGLNWGTNGRFIMMFAPWFPFLIEDTELQNYPTDVKLVVLQSYDDFHHGGGATYNTDPRILRAMYELINIPDSEKDYISVFSDNDVSHQYTYNGETYSYEANHYVIYTDLIDGLDNPYDRMDVYAINRLTNAMTSYVFEGDVNAKNVILGNGSNDQISMNIMPDLSVTDYYITQRPESEFQYKCTADPNGWSSTDIWKLSDYCVDDNGDGIIDILKIKNLNSKLFKVYPVPATDFIAIEFNNPEEQINKFVIYDNLSGIVEDKEGVKNNLIDISSLSKGVYFIKIKTKSGIGVKRFTIK